MNISTLISRLTKSELLELRAIIDKQIKIKPDWTRTNIEDLDISIRAKNCLAKNGITSLEEIRDMPPGVFIRMSNIGKKTFLEIMETLELHGMGANYQRLYKDATP
jgi:DNA-directed RNA polymerase alpha subunit